MYLDIFGRQKSWKISWGYPLPCAVCNSYRKFNFKNNNFSLSHCKFVCITLYIKFGLICTYLYIVTLYMYFVSKHSIELHIIDRVEMQLVTNAKTELNCRGDRSVLELLYIPLLESQVCREEENLIQTFSELGLRPRPTGQHTYTDTHIYISRLSSRPYSFGSFPTKMYMNQSINGSYFTKPLKLAWPFTLHLTFWEAFLIHGWHFCLPITENRVFFSSLCPLRKCCVRLI